MCVNGVVNMMLVEEGTLLVLLPARAGLFCN
jgi:hypothetical protein